MTLAIDQFYNRVFSSRKPLTITQEQTRSILEIQSLSLPATAQKSVLESPHFGYEFALEKLICHFYGILSIMRRRSI
jgi:hypothetical protein